MRKSLSNQLHGTQNAASGATNLASAAGLRSEVGLSLSEFVDQFQPGTDLTEEDLRMIFEFLDVDGSNLLSTAELMSGLDGFVPPELPELARLSMLEEEHAPATQDYDSRLPVNLEDSEIPVVQAALVSPPTECSETPSNPLPGLRDAAEAAAFVSPAPECSETPSNPPPRIWLTVETKSNIWLGEPDCENSAEERMNREDSTIPVAEETFSYGFRCPENISTP